MHTEDNPRLNRGEHGKAIAKVVPFRKGGRPCDYDETPRPSRPGGSRYKHAVAFAKAIFTPKQQFNLETA